jgi:ATP-dependent Lon protease
MGGEVLFIEATLLPGGRGLTITGQLGEVMQESARAAQSYLWSHASEFGLIQRCSKNMAYIFTFLPERFPRMDPVQV